MTPEEKLLLERSLKLSEENHRILKKMERRLRLAMIWGVIKLVVIFVPLIVGVFFLEPYLKDAAKNYEGIRKLITDIEFPL